MRIVIYDRKVRDENPASEKADVLSQARGASQTVASSKGTRCARARYGAVRLRARLESIRSLRTEALRPRHAVGNVERRAPQELLVLGSAFARSQGRAVAR